MLLPRRFVARDRKFTGDDRMNTQDEATEPSVHMIARRAASAQKTVTTNVTLTGADGQQRVIRP